MLFNDNNDLVDLNNIFFDTKIMVLCHVEAEICTITDFMTPVIEIVAGANPYHEFLKISDIFPREILANIFFLTNRYI